MDFGLPSNRFNGQKKKHLVSKNGSFAISFKSVVLGGLIGLLAAPVVQAKIAVIYGSDDRVDLYEETDMARVEWSKSTLALFRTSNLKQTGEGEEATYEIEAKTFKERRRLCMNERFGDQPTASFCSGFFVGKDLIVTAGHCVRTQSACESTRFVFDFAQETRGQINTQFDHTQVYKCKKLIAREQVSNGADFAVIQLQREVKDREPLALRKTGEIKEGDPLVVMGYPAGLPLKIADNAAVRDVKSRYFIANLDTYGGNSGSAVFNDSTGEVEGILVRGEVDYKLEGSCYVSNRCQDGECRGEDVSKIQDVLQYLNTLEAEQAGSEQGSGTLAQANTN